MPRLLPIAVGAAAGLALWIGFSAVRDVLPVWLRLIISGGVLVFGPGAGLAAPLLAPLSRLHRGVLAFSLGLSFAPAVAHLLGVAGALAIYPYLCAALAGGAVGYWRARGPAKAGPYMSAGDHSRPRHIWAPLFLVVFALAMGITAFSHRMTTDRGGAVVVHGAYDSFDLSYYGAIGAELSHTVPPASPFFAGRMLNHGFYPHVVLGLIHRFGDVPTLDLYFRYAWPAFLVLAVLTCFVFVESIADTWTAVLSAVLFGAGSNLAYLAVWFLPLVVWDDVVWSHNLQGGGAEVLFYGNWTPALAALFGGLYALNMAFRSPRVGWAVVAGVVLAATIMAKPWFFAIFMAALAVVCLTSLRTPAIARRALVVIGTSLLVAAPLLYRTFTLYDDAQVTFAPAFLPIPLRMVDRIGLRDWLPAQTALASALALPVFLIGTIGFRVVGLGAFWRALWRPGDEPPIWRVLAWAVLAALVAASVIVTVPYHETTQIHQCALFLLTMFTGRALGSWREPRTRNIAAAIVIAIAVPCTIHYLSLKWQDRQPMAAASGGEATLAQSLRATDPERTVILHDNPGDPQLVGLISARRSVLGWGSPDYVRGSEARRADVEAFFAGPDASKASSILRTYRPTHVIERRLRNRINPEVRDRLELVFRAADVALYRVPEHLLAPER